MSNPAPIYIQCYFADLDVAGTAGITNGMAAFVAPTSGWVNRIIGSALQNDTPGDQTRRIVVETPRGKDASSGSDYTSTAPAVSAAGRPLVWLLDQSRRINPGSKNSDVANNFVYAGETYAILSNGDGGADEGGECTLVVEFIPGTGA